MKLRYYLICITMNFQCNDIIFVHLYIFDSHYKTVKHTVKSTSIFCFIFCLMPHNTQSVCEPGPELFIVMFFVTIVLLHKHKFQSMLYIEGVTDRFYNIHKCGNIKFWSTYFMLLLMLRKCCNIFCYLYLLWYTFL